MGCRHPRIILSHILPNVTAPISIIASIWLGNAILIEASLSFLGVGTQPPTPSWGLMLSSTGRAFMEQAPWLAIFPGPRDQPGRARASTSSVIPFGTHGIPGSGVKADRAAERSVRAMNRRRFLGLGAGAMGTTDGVATGRGRDLGATDAEAASALPGAGEVRR